MHPIVCKDTTIFWHMQVFLRKYVIFVRFWSKNRHFLSHSSLGHLSLIARSGRWLFTEGVAEVKTANKNGAFLAYGNRAHRTPWHATIGGSEKPMSGYNPDVINEEKRRMVYRITTKKRGTVANMPPNRTTGILCRTIQRWRIGVTNDEHHAYHAGQLTKEETR